MHRLLRESFEMEPLIKKLSKITCELNNELKYDMNHTKNFTDISIFLK